MKKALIAMSGGVDSSLNRNRQRLSDTLDG